MTAWVRSVLAQYGQNVTVETAEGAVSARASLQPLTERQEQVAGTMTDLGWNDDRLWLYLGQTAVSEGDTVTDGKMRFRVRSSRPYYIGEELTHWWASLEREKEAAE